MSASMQMSIFDPPLARATDPETSQRAADRAHQFIESHEAKIYGAILGAGERGATYREIAMCTGLEPAAVGRRLTYLERRHVIKPLDITRDGCRVWVKG